MSGYDDNTSGGWDDDRVRWETAEERARAGWLDEQRLDRRDRDLPYLTNRDPGDETDFEVAA